MRLLLLHIHLKSPIKSQVLSAHHIVVVVVVVFVEIDPFLRSLTKRMKKKKKKKKC